MPATDLKIKTFVLIPNFNTQKEISKKLQTFRKKNISNIKLLTNLLSNTTLFKRIRTPSINPIIFFYRFKNVQNNPQTEQNQTDKKILIKILTIKVKNNPTEKHSFSNS